MASAVKKTTFEEYHLTLATILNNIDEALTVIKNRQKNLPVWKGFDSFKDFLKDVEKAALKKSAQDLEIGTTTVRDRWRVLTLPFPVYAAIEDGDITFSKAKLLTAINFDFDNDSDAQVASDIVQEIKGGLKVPEIKKLVEEKSPEVWNPSDIIMQRIAGQHGITADTTC
jgi:hypothetical protein